MTVTAEEKDSGEEATVEDATEQQQEDAPRTKADGKWIHRIRQICLQICLRLTVSTSMSDGQNKMMKSSSCIGLQDRDAGLILTPSFMPWLSRIGCRS
jgi:hypothetical protein